MKHTAKIEHRQSTHNGGTMTTPFNTILNPSTGKMVLSGGRVGSKLIKNYTADTILNPKSKKLVMTGGKVGKNVLETYKNGYLKGGETTEETAEPVRVIVDRCNNSLGDEFFNKHIEFKSIGSEIKLMVYLRYIYLIVNEIPLKLHKPIYRQFYPITGVTNDNNKEVQRKFLNFLADIVQPSIKCTKKQQQRSILSNPYTIHAEVGINEDVKQTDTYTKIVKPLTQFWKALAVKPQDQITGETFTNLKMNVPNDVKNSFKLALDKLNIIIQIPIDQMQNAHKQDQSITYIKHMKEHNDQPEAIEVYTKRHINLDELKNDMLKSTLTTRLDTILNPAAPPPTPPTTTAVPPAPPATPPVQKAAPAGGKKKRNYKKYKN